MIRRNALPGTGRRVEHYVGDGASVYRQACKLSYEAIVSKRLRPRRTPTCAMEAANKAKMATEGMAQTLGSFPVKKVE